MEITDKNLIINYLSFCSVSPSLFFLLSTPVLGAKKKSARSLLNLKKKKKKEWCRINRGSLVMIS